MTRVLSHLRALETHTGVKLICAGCARRRRNPPPLPYPDPPTLALALASQPSAQHEPRRLLQLMETTAHIEGSQEVILNSTSFGLAHVSATAHVKFGVSMEQR